ncbi:P-loop containing nucleoside triphosphate hydrolase protein, partial [Sistotremastrum niveocremeum HHB9708]
MASTLLNWIIGLGLGMGPLGSVMHSPYVYDSLRLLVLGSIVEFGRRFMYWAMERFKIRFSMTATFREGDQAYEWLMLLLTEERVWEKSRDFQVAARSSQRKWGINSTLAPPMGPGFPELPFPTGGDGGQILGNAEYVPQYGAPHLFKYKGYWFEINRTQGETTFGPYGRQSTGGGMSLTVYSLRMSTLTELVESARLLYTESSKPRVTIHESAAQYGGADWSRVITKYRRPLESLILEEETKAMLLADAQEFLESGNWYVDKGIPHRRGYLLYGPPGTGKSSTIYTLAGELGLEIYTLSLSANMLNDGSLKQIVAGVPSHSILLIEDIDCAFPSREDEEEEMMTKNQMMMNPYLLPPPKSAITLSGLLNVIDGWLTTLITEEGRIFFCTTNHVDRLDPALLRPGRIDVKVEYKAASQNQARDLFTSFFTETSSSNPGTSSSPSSPSSEKAESSESTSKSSSPSESVQDYALRFSETIPQHEFTVAELQGYLLLHKKDAQSAVDNAEEWVSEQNKEREERKRVEKEKKEE